MRRFAYVALCLAPLACSKKHCPPQPPERFAGTDVPSQAIGNALKGFAAQNKVCGTTGRATVVLSSSRSDALTKLGTALKAAGLHDVPGRDHNDGTAMIVHYFKPKDDKLGDLVELAVYGGDACTFGDVCVKVQGYSVVPR